MANENDNIAVVVDEEGREISLEVLDMFTLDDIEYALLLPVGHHEKECDCGCEDEAVIMRVKRDGEEYYFEQIENDEEFDKVAAYIEEIEDEIDD
jgi:uncharacterized protein YrzB (UPF0473 family)